MVGHNFMTGSFSTESTMNCEVESEENLNKFALKAF